LLERPAWLFLVLALVMTVSAWSSGEAYLGADHVDLVGAVWHFWWCAFALGEGMSPFESSWTFFPTGQFPLNQFNLLDGILYAPLIWIFGVRMGFNMACAFILASTGWAGHTLARSMSMSSLGAVVVGVGLECSAFVVEELVAGRPTQALLLFFLLALAGIARIARGTASWGTSLWTGLAAAALALTYWYNAVFFLVAAIVVWLAHRKQLDGDRWRKACGAALTCVVICAPLLVVLGTGYAELPGVGTTENASDGLVALTGGDVGLRIAAENSGWPLWPLVGTPGEISRALSPLLLGLALLGLVRRAEGRWLALGLFGTGWLMSLGPYLRFADPMPTAFPLPFLLVHDHLPFMSRLWWPQRWEALCAIGLALLAGRAVGQLRSDGRLEGWRGAALIAALVVSAAARGDRIPIPASVPATASTALYEGLEGPILSTPLRGGARTAGLVLLAQTSHRQIITGGVGQHMPTHTPLGHQDFLAGNPLLSGLVELERSGFATVEVAPSDIQALIDAGLRYAVVDPACYLPGLEARWASSYASVYADLFGEPLRRANGGAVWELRPIEEARMLRMRFAAKPDPSLR